MKTNRTKLTTVIRGTRYLLSLNLLVFLRRDFGERVASDLCVSCGFSWFCFWCYGGVRSRVSPSLPEPHLSPLFLYALTALTAYHVANMRLRRQQPTPIHSFSTGRPWDVWRSLGFNDLTLQRYVQPVACSLVAVGISRVDRILAFWIGAASIAVFIGEQLTRFQMRRRVLDSIDSRIESQTLYGQVQEKLSPASKSEAQSPVIEIAGPPSRNAGKLSEIITRLDPEVRKMIEPGPSKEKTP